MSESKTPPKKQGPMGGGPPMARGPVSKAQDFKGTLKKLINYLAPQKVKFYAVFVLAILSTTFAIVGPKIMGKATTKLGDGLIAKITYIFELQTAIRSNAHPSVIADLRNTPIPMFDMEYIGRIIIILIVLYVFSSLLSFIMAYVMSDVAQNTVFKMRNDVKEKLDRLPLKFFDTKTHGEILSRVTNDMDNIAQTLQQSMTQTITSVVTILGTIVMMISISPILTLIALMILPLSSFIMMQIVKRSQKFYAEQQKIIGELNGHVEEMYTGHKIVKGFGYETESIGEFQKLNKQLYSVGWKAQFMSGIIFPALNFVNRLGYVAICVVGGIFVANNQIKIGDIQAFIQYANNFMQPLAQIANIANVLQSTIASAERVFEILEEEEEVKDVENPVHIEKVSGVVNFDHVNFSYKADAPLIEDMSIDVKSGQTIAIVGPTGAGKTTIVNLLMRFYELNGGGIYIDGVNIADMARADLRKYFGMVLQDTWLFNGTIFDNIKYGNENATDEEVIQAARVAKADKFIRTLPDGYDSLLNEEASNISQGQKQLLTIARAILANPVILILDEATSNVDTRTEVLIQKAMNRLMEGRTCFVIAHRLSTIKNADRILVMNQGTVIEQGTHDELLEQKGFYADLYNSQFAEE